MNKVLVEINLPALDKKLDLLIPKNKRLSNVVILIGKLLNELSDGEYLLNNNVRLYNEYTGIVYDLSITINQANIKNGTRLLLI